MIDHPFQQYSFPEDLKQMSTKDKELLAISIREFLLDNISKTGGHLASNLGIVELAIAVHSCFDAPKDKIVWDVGHQAYVHKILTGRAGRFDSLRQLGGISGFPNKDESPYDLFTTGHSSNSVSLLTGLAVARDLQKESYETVAIIGDGALTGGLAYEGMNNLGALHSRSIVIVNDNGMSIGRNTGAVSSHLGKLRTSKGYYSFKRRLRGALSKVPAIGDNILGGMEKLRDTLKYALVDGVLFEELGFTYLGPVDGHDIEDLEKHLKMARHVDGPVMIHVRTVKGKGYRNAENNPDLFHGTGAFDKTTGQPHSRPLEMTYSEFFGRKLIAMAKENPRIVSITAAMCDGTGLRGFEDTFPDRLIDTGIAEGHAVTFAGGLARGGQKPFVAIYSTFLQRGYDQLITDVCLQNLPVVFCIDRAGIVGADGETHHGIFDLSYLPHIPRMTVLAPADGRELEDMMDYAMTINGPCAIRYPKGSGENDVQTEENRVPIKEGAVVLKKSNQVMICAIGSMVERAMSTISLLEEDGIDAGLINARFAAPIDEETILDVACRCKLFVTCEDNVLRGGFGERVAGLLFEYGISTPVLSIGWPDTYIEHGSIDALMDKYGLSEERIRERIREAVERTS